MDSWLQEVLHDIDLDSYYDALTRRLKLNRPEHFDEKYLKDSDLESIGLPVPARRRLRDAVKKYKQRGRKDKLLSKFGLSKSEPQGSPKQEEQAPDTSLIDRQDLDLGLKIGEGSFAIVLRGVWTRKNKKIPVAVKQLVSRDGYESVPDETMLSEIRHMQHLRHPHLIRLYGIVVEKPILMVVELCEGGALLDRLRSETKPRPRLDYLWSTVQQIADGMSYLERKGLIHRDLAARNVLLSVDEKVAKIGDFGLMRPLPNPDQYYVTSAQKKIPFAWCPPESLRQHKFSHASDVWSFGVVLWEIFTFGDEPWSVSTAQQILDMVSRGERLTKPQFCHDEIYQLMLYCWAPDPGDRPKFGYIKHSVDWFAFQTGKVKEPCHEHNLLSLNIGDSVIIINGKPEQHYWLGQNVRSRQVGQFPRKAVMLEGVDRKDCISLPVRGSFIHAGHGAIGLNNGDGWGDPGKIDPIYLKNPMPLIKFHEDQHSVSSGSGSDSWQTFDDPKDTAPPVHNPSRSYRPSRTFDSFSEDPDSQSGSLEDLRGPLQNGYATHPGRHSAESIGVSSIPTPPKGPAGKVPPPFDFEPVRYLPPPPQTSRPVSCPPQDPAPEGQFHTTTPQDPRPQPSNIPQFDPPPPILKKMIANTVQTPSLPKPPQQTTPPPPTPFVLPTPPPSGSALSSQSGAPYKYSFGSPTQPQPVPTRSDVVPRPVAPRAVVPYVPHTPHTTIHNVRQAPNAGAGSQTPHAVVPHTAHAPDEKDPFVIPDTIQRLTLSKPYSQMDWSATHPTPSAPSPSRQGAYASTSSHPQYTVLPPPGMGNRRQSAGLLAEAAAAVANAKAAPTMQPAHPPAPTPTANHVQYRTDIYGARPLSENPHYNRPVASTIGPASRHPPLNYFPDPPRPNSAGDITRATWHGRQSEQAGPPVDKSALLDLFDPLTVQAAKPVPKTGAPKQDPNPAAITPEFISEAVKLIRQQVPSIPEAKCQRALKLKRGNVPETVRWLKLEKLTDLGIASKERCWSALDSANWDLNTAASSLMDTAS